MITYPISKKTIDICTTFSGLSANDYSSRGQSNKVKVKEDILFGKISEFAVAHHLRKQFGECTVPDTAIYERGERSYAPDLTTPRGVVHVKSCRMNPHYDPSWLFEKNDTEVFAKPYAGDVAFCVVDTDAYEVTVVAIVPLKTLHEKKLFLPPRLAHLTTKVAVYAKDLAD